MPSRALRTCLRGVAFAAVLMAGSGCSSSVKAERSPDQATEAVRQTLSPPKAQLDCLKGKFTEQPEIAAIFNVGEPATADERDGYVRAIRACIPIEDFATLVSASAFGSGDVPGGTTDDTAPDSSSPGAGASTAACVRDAVLRATPAEQDRLYLYFSNPAAIDAKDIAPTTKAISDACGLGATTGTVPGAGPS